MPVTLTYHKFGNRIYQWSGAHSTKAEADKRAKQLRDAGYNARVHKRTAPSMGKGSVYDVYRYENWRKRR